MIDGIESLKTADVEILRHAIQYRMQNFDVITFYYDQDQRFCKLKMKSYQGRQQALDEIARRLTYGSKKYGHQPKPMHQHMVSPIPRRRQSWTPISSGKASCPCQKTTTPLAPSVTKKRSPFGDYHRRVYDVPGVRRVPPEIFDTYEN
jgi:hypothetical protein